MKEITPELIQEALKLYQDGKDKRAVEILSSSEIPESVETYLLLGEIYENPSSGSGLKRNVKKAINNWETALNFKSGEAAYKLGMLYSLGDGIKENLERSIFYWKKGLEYDDALSAFELSKALIDKNSEIETALEALNFLLNDDTLAGTACFYLYKIYASQNSGLFNIEKAIGYLEQGCTLGKVTCCMKLAELHWSGKQVEKSNKKALQYIEQAKLCKDDLFENEITHFEQLLRAKS